jgi:N-methylhydantoinase A
VINAYVQPVVQRYVQAMQSHLDALGVQAPLLIMQSNGGLMPADAAREAPMHIIESGPAAGVMGALTLGRQMGIGNIITLDIGGTTAKTSLIEHGELTRSPEYEVGGGMSMGHRLLKGGGYLLRVPSVDIAEVGAGGGSLAWVDRGGSLHVGPQSAGASPGPACYDLGGESATLTDANVVLGYLNPEALAGGRLRLNPSLAEQVIAEQVARPLDVEVVDAAWAVHRLADATMVRALRTVSTERGRDPRLFTLFAFGGKGPAHAIGIAQALQISRVVIPPVPGLFSSLALLFSEVEHHFSQTFFHTAAELDPDELQPVLARLQHQAQEQLQTDGYSTAQSHLSYFADMRYAGQNSELTIPLQAEHLTVQALAQLQEAFAQEHERMYGYRSDGEPVQLMGLRVVARGLADATRVPELLRIADTMLPSDAGQTVSRRAYFGPQHGWIDTPVMSRQALGQAPIAGPIIVEEYDATTVVPPGCRATLDRWSNIHVVVDLS